MYVVLATLKCQFSSYRLDCSSLAGLLKFTLSVYLKLYEVQVKIHACCTDPQFVVYRILQFHFMYTMHMHIHD
jgi:hypothetical protein